MKTQILNFLTKNNIPFTLGQEKGGFESISIPYKQRAEFIEYLRKNKVKIRNIQYLGKENEYTWVNLIFEKESKF